MNSRRDFLYGITGFAAGAFGLPGLAFGQDKEAPQIRPKVAVVMTVFTYRSHAHVILENFLCDYLFNGKRTEAGCEVASFYVDQFPGGEMARAVAKQFDIPIYDTIDGALCLGGDKLAVDGVVSIGEHGKYPTNAKAQIEYPRKRFFDEIVAVFKKSGRVAPLFNDKHLSYRWDWAKEMYDTCREMEIPFMAGSSVPLAQRRPPLEITKGAELEQVVSIHGGGVESYDFHCLEVLQSMVESRAGGETGISEVQFLERDELWAAAEKGLWSPGLANAAMAAEVGDVKPAFRETVEKQFGNRMHGILIKYKDGLRAAALSVGGSGTRWNFACRMNGGQLRATHFYVGPWQNRNLFRALSHAIQAHIKTGMPPYSVERTLLVTGALDAAMDSRIRDGAVQKTPQLEFVYDAIDFEAMREMGASWKIITDDIEQPKGIVPVGLETAARPKTR